MSVHWGKAVPYLKVISVMCAWPSPQRIFLSLTSVSQQRISEVSRPALTFLKPLHGVRVYILLHWKHHLPMAFWGRRRLMPESWQQSNPWAWRANPIETHPSLPLFRASRGKNNGALEPLNGRSLLQRLVGVLLWKLLEFIFFGCPESSLKVFGLHGGASLSTDINPSAWSLPCVSLTFHG